MKNTFGSRWFITIVGEVYCLVWNETSHLYFSAAEKISLYCKKNNKKRMVLQDALSVVDASKQFYKINMVRK